MFVASAVASKIHHSRQNWPYPSHPNRRPHTARFTTGHAQCGNGDARSASTDIASAERISERNFDPRVSSIIRVIAPSNGKGKLALVRSTATAGTIPANSRRKIRFVRAVGGSVAEAVATLPALEVSEDAEEMAVFREWFEWCRNVRPAEDANYLFIVIDNMVGSGCDAELGQTLMVARKRLFVAAGEERRQPMGVSDFPPDTGARPERHVESAMPEFWRSPRAQRGAGGGPR